MFSYAHYSSHIDITAVQALIDTRDEVERWADAPVEFHFATLLSPWIRRALVAGGFGIGFPASFGPRELAAILPYDTDMPFFTGRNFDVEALPGKSSSDSPTAAEFMAGGHRTESSRGEPASTLLATDTPFFHLDLAAAVRAAEQGLKRTSSGSVLTHRRDTDNKREPE